MPTSYQAPMRGDKDGDKTVSQSASSNMAKDFATVQQVLDQKGSEVVTIGPDATVATAVAVLKERKIGALVVTDANGALCGILSERDIVRKLAETPGQTLPQKVSENMTSEVVTCGADETLIAILRKMTDGRFRHMPVTRDGALAGLVTIGDVVSYRINELEHEALQLKQMIVG